MTFLKKKLSKFQPIFVAHQSFTMDISMQVKRRYTCIMMATVNGRYTTKTFQKHWRVKILESDYTLIIFTSIFFSRLFRKRSWVKTSSVVRNCIKLNLKRFNDKKCNEKEKSEKKITSIHSKVHSFVLRTLFFKENIFGVRICIIWRIVVFGGVTFLYWIYEQILITSLFNLCVHLLCKTRQNIWVEFSDTVMHDSFFDGNEYYTS